MALNALVDSFCHNHKSGTERVKRHFRVVSATENLSRVNASKILRITTSN